jgi:hypothetical protein
VVRLSALATLLPEKKLVLEAGWVLELVWMFGEELVLLLLLRFELQIFQCISKSLY